MSNYYDDLLQLCGWEVEEIDQERPRIEKTFQRLELGPEDMETAMSWVRQNHDVTLMGVRKLLGAWLKELIDLILAKDEGKKIVYYSFPTVVRPGMLIAASAEGTYVGGPDVILCHTMGQIFNKLTPILEAGEENGLPPGHALCSVWQVKVGALAKGIIPPPDMAIASSYFCDMGSKADDLLAEIYGTPIEYVDGTMDSAWGEYPDYLPERAEFLGAQFNQLFDKVKEVMGFEVDFKAWDRVMPDIREYFGDLYRIFELMQADPVPISSVEVELATILAVACTGRGIAEGAKAVKILIPEIEKRVKENIGVVEKGAPRVMVALGSFSDASVTRMIENTGLAIPIAALDVRVQPPPPKVQYDTVGERIADGEIRGGVGLFHSSFGTCHRMAANLEQVKGIDGFIYNYQFNCRPVAQVSHCLKSWVEEKTGIPCLSLENDIADSRSYSAAAMRTRVETFAEMLKARKVAN